MPKSRKRPRFGFSAGQDIIYRRPAMGQGVDMEIQGLGKIVIFAGVVLTVIGVLMLLAPKLPFIGKLPGIFTSKRTACRFTSRSRRPS
ncbi:MAG: DUF2905 family protein [Thermodesulfobacteriota bacterium]